MKENTNSESLCVQQARALVDVVNQSAATRAARRAELDTLQDTALLAEKMDPGEAAEKAADFARISTLLQIAEAGFAGSKARAGRIAGEIIDLLVPIERKLSETNRANIETARQYVTRKLSPWFSEYDLPAAVGRTKIFLAEIQFASDRGQAPSYYCDESIDASGARIVFCRSLQGLLAAHDKARENVAAVEAHAVELGRTLK
jgi:hypothetical protein